MDDDLDIAVFAGSRTLSENICIPIFREYLSEFGFPELIISGGARGVDSCAEAFAYHTGIAFEAMPADWKTHGKAAGPLRNIEMAQRANRGLVIIENMSRGSVHMVSELYKLKKDVAVVHFHDGEEVSRAVYHGANDSRRKWKW